MRGQASASGHSTETRDGLTGRPTRASKVIQFNFKKVLSCRHFMRGLKNKYNIPEIQMIDRLSTPIRPRSRSTIHSDCRLTKCRANKSFVQPDYAGDVRHECVYSGPPVQWDNVVGPQTMMHTTSPDRFSHNHCIVVEMRNDPIQKGSRGPTGQAGKARRGQRANQTVIIIQSEVARKKRRAQPIFIKL